MRAYRSRAASAHRDPRRPIGDRQDDSFSTGRLGMRRVLVVLSLLAFAVGFSVGANSKTPSGGDEHRGCCAQPQRRLRVHERQRSLLRREHEPDVRMRLRATAIAASAIGFSILCIGYDQLFGSSEDRMKSLEKDVQGLKTAAVEKKDIEAFPDREPVPDVPPEHHAPRHGHREDLVVLYDHRRTWEGFRRRTEGSGWCEMSQANGRAGEK